MKKNKDMVDMSKVAFRIRRGAIMDDLFTVEMVDVWGKVIGEYGDVVIEPGGGAHIGRKSYFLRQQIAQEQESKK